MKKKKIEIKIEIDLERKFFKVVDFDYDDDFGAMSGVYRNKYHFLNMFNDYCEKYIVLDLKDDESELEELFKRKILKSKSNKTLLKKIIENGRRSKKMSQRELARRIGVSNVSVNDLERGQIQKPSIEVLVNISEELDISIIELLRAAGYERLLFLLNNDELKIDNK